MNRKAVFMLGPDAAESVLVKGNQTISNRLASRTNHTAAGRSLNDIGSTSRGTLAIRRRRRASAGLWTIGTSSWLDLRVRVDHVNDTGRRRSGEDRW